MSKYRQAARVDSNQSEIVDMLRQIPGISVSVGHDDILVGHLGKTYWYEIKVSEKSPIKSSQTRLLKEWRGHYKIVWSLNMILEDLKIAHI